jgi:hypothetical protein
MVTIVDLLYLPRAASHAAGGVVDAYCGPSAVGGPVEAADHPVELFGPLARLAGRAAAASRARR